MHIAIDAHSVGTRLAGNTTYITSLIDALAEIDQQNRYTLYVTRPEAVERYSGQWSNFVVRRTLPHTPFIRIPITLTAELLMRRVDLVFVQFTAPPFVPCKLVTAIHDISYEHLPETFNRRSRFQMKLTIRNTARRADHIITPSEYSRQDVITTYRIPPEKVSTVLQSAPDRYEPLTDETELTRIRRKYDLNGDYFLGVGSIQPRKNLVRLIEAYALLSGRCTDLPPLLLVGNKAWLSSDSLQAAEKHGVSDKVRFTGFVPDEDLPGLYTMARIFVYPSFFEGFGIPPLEAMRCGTPVIAGNRTSLPEVVGDAGLLVDPFDVSAIADAIEKLHRDRDLRESLRKRGFERARSFSWKRTAQQTLEIFRTVVEQR